MEMHIKTLSLGLLLAIVPLGQLVEGMATSDNNRAQNLYSLMHFTVKTLFGQLITHCMLMKKKRKKRKKKKKIVFH